MPRKSPKTTAVASGIPPSAIEQRILFIRRQKVLLDVDLAALYGVETRSLLQAVRRNAERFPKDFSFQLTNQEVIHLKSQIVISSDAGRGPLQWGGRRTRPYAFTEQGVAMLSTVLHSPRAIAVNIEIMRAFVRLRQVLASHKDLARKLATLEKKYDTQFKAVFEAIRQLMTPPVPKRRGIGFVIDED